jgi:hypothetical protein
MFKLIAIIVVSCYICNLRGYFKSNKTLRINIYMTEKKVLFDNTDIKNKGMDERFGNMTDKDTDESMRVLHENLEKLILLNKLQRNSTSQLEKINIINNSDLINITKPGYVTTLHAGGLFNDFNNTF